MAVSAVLASFAGIGYHYTEHTLQISETHILSPKTINETRFEYQHTDNTQVAQNLQPQVSVSGAFTGGGSNLGNSSISLNHFDIQNYTSLALGKHFTRFGED